MVFLIVFVLASASFPVIGGLEASDDGMKKPTPYERYLHVQKMFKDLNGKMGNGQFSTIDGNAANSELGLNIEPNADGSLPGMNSGSIMDLMDNPPYFIGWGLEATAASDHYVVGHGHETYFGDVNDDGLLSWLVFYFDMGLSVNGLDDDGDGCIDEARNVSSSGETCDNIPDAVVFFDTGYEPDISGDLVAYSMSVDGALKVFRIGVTPRWVVPSVRDLLYVYSHIEIAGEFVFYSASEFINYINVNKAIGDKDTSDYFIGMIDARGFPARPFKHHYCRTGGLIHGGSAYLRDDGSVLFSFPLSEPYDNAPGYDNDYNDDGDTHDAVAGYFIVDPRKGRCNRAVNIGVSGYGGRVAGNVISVLGAYEEWDSRDWNNDGDMIDYVGLWHDATSTESLAGNPYFGYTFRTSVPRGPPGLPDSYGFGFTGVYSESRPKMPVPLEFGGAYYQDALYPYYWSGYYWHVLDEDWKQWTELPAYYIEHGEPVDDPGGVCLCIRGRADFDGDGQFEIVAAVYCPNRDEPGTGEWESDPASSHPPWFPFGNYYSFSSGGTNLITLPYYYLKGWTPPGGGTRKNYWVSGNWHFNKVDPSYDILDAQWVDEPRVRVKESISGFVDVENSWEVNILCHARLANDLAWGMRYDGCVENTERDGILRPGETARIHFTVYAPDKGKGGLFTLTIELTLQRVTRVFQLDVELHRKGN